MSTNKDVTLKDQSNYLPVFKRYPIALKNGKGCKVWDVEGNAYLDALAGIAVNNLGHCHPAIVETIQRQAGELMHVSNFFSTQQQADLAHKMVSTSGLDRAFFTNSGAESVEGAIKLARKYAWSQNKGGKIISVKKSFHGRTMATIATGKKEMQKGFAPIPEGFAQAELNDINSVKHLIDKRTAAVILEPIQGEGGINVSTPEFLKELRALCDENDVALIFDEIQCGIGRTGKMYAKNHYGIQPDIMTFAKGLGSGFPMGAVLANKKISDALDFGDHGTTFGGNPLACAVGLTTYQVIKNEDLLNKVRKNGEYLMSELRNLNLSGTKEIRGKGLMVGVEFDFETKPLVLKMLENHVIANATAGNVLRLVPPLVIAKNEIDHLLQIIVKSHKQTV